MVRDYTFLHRFILGVLTLSIMSSVCFGDISEQLLQTKTQIEVLIESNDDAATEAAIEQMKLDFSGHPDLPWQLYEISRKYTQTGNMPALKSICQEIASQYPDSDASVYARSYVARFVIEDMILDGKPSEAEAAIAQLKSDFVNFSELPWRLYELSQKYIQIGNMPAFESICREIASQYPDSDASVYARSYMVRFAIEEMILDGKLSEAEAAIAQLRSDFANFLELPWRLYELSQKYIQTGDMTHFRSVCQQLVSEYPDAAVSVSAKTQLARYAIEDLIDRGDTVAADAEILQMKSDFAGHPELPFRLWDVGSKYEILQYFSKSKALYQEILNDYPQEKTLNILCRAKLAAHDILDRLRNGDTAATDTAISQVKSQFKDPYEKTLTLFVIAENISVEVSRLGQEQDSIAAECLNRAMPIYENDVLNTVLSDSNNDVKAGAYYMLGLGYQRLKEYSKALQAFSNSYQANPKFQYADYCLYAQGYCSERMMKEETMTPADAKTIITMQYQQLISEFPKSHYTKKAQVWLDANLQ